jgi:acetyl-CoA carboxylase biotin carboxyl carrier protein
VELTNEDVADILELLDSLPYDELDLRTSRFRLTLRRAAGGGWTQSRQETAEPRALDSAAGHDRGEPAAPGSTASGSAASGSTAPEGAAPEGAAPEGAAPGIVAGDDPGDRAGAAGPGADGTGTDATGTDATGTDATGTDGTGTDSGAGLAEVAAPLPGTFYRAPRPGAAPFVEVGSQVSAGTVVAIVETMKLMNSVHAGTAGRVAQILIGNGEPVTQGASLMRIEPAQ